MLIEDFIIQIRKLALLLGLVHVAFIRVIVIASEAFWELPGLNALNLHTSWLFSVAELFIKAEVFSDAVIANALLDRLVHHSHIINRNAVEKYIKGEGGQVVMKNGIILDVARRKKEEFMKAIGY